MRWLRFAVLIIFATVLQAGFLANFNYKPDLLLILLVFFSVYASSSEAIVSSFVIGLAADLIGPVMGPQTISFGLFGTLLAYMHRVIAFRKMHYQALAIFVMSILTGLLTTLLNLIRGEPILSEFFVNILKISLISGILGPFLFLPAAWWMRIQTNRFRRK
ncbi:MAG: rod shape-determining protein MreD [Sedimentisphaerales bacterium]|nr:rod shape-determining protein MreD [Sedimentisphaerales bacterium]